ncbi:IclR family transcriptional regulator [Dactylosporangium sp. NPDC051541]|uniref:IclR family transcriptional regulator n=1 Tax=Dactylosporangium sp. NPDC051541 TaxID=3363977 RepID=UPI00378F5623
MTTGMPSGSIDKALTVLEALAEHSRLTDIAAASGLPKSTVHRILQSLIGWGFALADGNGGYLPGPRILTLAGRVMSRFDPAQHARAALRDLRDRTGMTVHFAIRGGDEIVYVDKIEGRRPYQMKSRVGMSVPLHTTAIGKVVLAQLDDAETAAIVGRTGLAAITARSITDPAVLREQLGAARVHGYAVDDGENDTEIRCIGAAVFDHTGNVLGGISISALSFELDLASEALIAEVTAAADAVSLALGAPAARLELSS